MGNRLIASASVAALLAMPVSVMAQATTQALDAQRQRTEAQSATEAKDLDKVMVTSTRRSEKLQDVPLSVTVLQQDQLDAKGIVGYEGVAQQTPGVVLNRASANFNNFTARGIATNGYGANLQSTVAIYMDDMPISANGNSTILDPSLYDVERVEFLRGPQGTLFGSGSLAGALRILTHAPDLTGFDASFLADVGMTGSDSLRQRYNAMVNIPLVKDTLAFRAVVFSRDEDGYVDNLGTGIKNANSFKGWGGRGTLLWKPTDDFSAQLRFSREGSMPADASLVNPDRGLDKRYSDRPDLYNGTINNTNLTLDYKFSAATLTSSSTWTTFKGLFNIDLAGAYNQNLAFALDAPGENHTFVQEVRLVSNTDGPLEWVLGGFYYKRNRDVWFGYRSNEAFLAKSGITGLPDGVYYNRYQTFDVSKEEALYGQVTWHFNDNLWADVGLRYGSAEAQGFIRGGGYNSDYLTQAFLYGYFGVPGGPLTVTPIDAAAGEKAKETKPSYRVSVSWRPQEAITTYVAVATGFRAPVVNSSAGSVSTLDPNDIVIPHGADSDKLINYELGMKGRWLDGRVTSNLALYYIDWSNIQVQVNRTSDQAQFATNIGGAYSEGLEYEFTAMPSMNWTISLTGAFNRAKVNRLTAEESAISGAVVGSKLSGPAFSGTLTVNYGFDWFFNAAGNASLAVTHVDGFPNQFPYVPGQPGVPSPTYTHTDSYNLVNANLSAAFSQWTVGVYAENLFNNRAINYAHPEAFADSRFGINPPRTVGVRFGYQFR